MKTNTVSRRISQNRLVAYTLGVAGISAASSGVAYGTVINITDNLPNEWKNGGYNQSNYATHDPNFPHLPGSNTGILKIFSGGQYPAFFVGVGGYNGLRADFIDRSFSTTTFGPEASSHFSDWFPNGPDITGEIIGFREGTHHYGYLVFDWTAASMEIRVTAGFIESEADKAIVVAFTPASSVPDAGSSLVLLSLGSAGLIALRRKLKAA